MTDVADLFPGFAYRWIETEAGRMFSRVGGSGPPLVLLHGFPQTHVCWHPIAPKLARRFTVVMPDLRGYGWSAAPKGDGGREIYTKRAMARDVVRIMQELGYASFDLVGHDRGARVGYRLALDNPGRISRLALLDIVPTFAVWKQMERDLTVAPHWRLLAKPYPEPEDEIVKDALGYMESLLRKWSKTGDLTGFDASALEHYRAAFDQPPRIHAFCEDYRAGAGTDVADDERDLAARRRIACPTLLVSGRYYLKEGLEASLQVWRESFAPHISGAEVDAAHFVAEEAAEETLAALLSFLRN